MHPRRLQHCAPALPLILICKVSPCCKAACIWIFLTNFHLNTWLKNPIHFASNTIPLVGREGLWQKLYYIQCLCFQCGKEEEVNKAPISIFRKLPSFHRIPTYFPSCAPWDTRQYIISIITPLKNPARRAGGRKPEALVPPALRDGFLRGVWKEIAKKST